MGEIIDVEMVAVGSVAVALIAAKDRIVQHIRSGDGFEPQSLALWGEWCRDGGMVLDIGAYDGLYAIAAALYGCSVIAFEPLSFNHARTLKNASLNKVEIGCIKAAASDNSGQAQLLYNPKVDFTSGASLVGRSVPRIDVRYVYVETVTIDSLKPLKLAGALNAIKIDVERAEPLVLRGARETLARFKPKLLVESLGPLEREAVLAEVPDYRLADVLDERNLVLLPE